VTAAGRVELVRRSARCPACGLTAYPTDLRVGLDGFLSPQATRLACLAAASWSFAIASDRLDQIAGLRIDDQTIRRHCHEAAADPARRREAAPPVAAFAKAQGDVEFLVDGVMVPTRDGWREVKMAIFQVRPAGEPAGPGQWADRELPGPTASVASATTADSRAFSDRWAPWAVALGIDPAGDLTVLADGAAWIWSAAAEHFPAAGPVLDIFHASQHIAAAGAGLRGEGTAAAAEWLERGRARLLAGAARSHRGHAVAGADAVGPGGDRRGDPVFRQAHRPGRLLRPAAHGPVDRQRGGGGPGASDGPTAEGAGPGLVRGPYRRDGGADRDGRYSAVGGPVDEARRLNSRIESYTGCNQLSWWWLGTLGGLGDDPNRIPRGIAVLRAETHG